MTKNHIQDEAPCELCHRRVGLVESSMRVIGLTLACVAFTSFGNAVCGAEQRPQGGSLVEHFQQLDRDGDGKLSTQELQRFPYIQRADSNHDGFVTLDEARILLGRRNRSEGPQPESGSGGNRVGLFQLFQRIPMSSGPLAVGVLGVDSDDWLDLILPSGWQSGQFSIALNRPDPERGRAFQVRTLEMSRDPADSVKRRITKGLGLHDFNNDGRMDVYLCNGDRGGPSLAPDGETVRPGNSNASSINSVQFSRGDGTFETRNLGIDSRGSTVRAVLFSDFDGDGYFDSYHSVSPYYGPGWGGSPFGNELHPGTAKWDRFGPDVIRDILPDPSFWQDGHGRGIKLFKAALIRDLDGDGRPDIVTGAYADIWGGSFRRLQTPEDAKLDLDEDGIPDTTWPGVWERGLFLLRNISTPGRIRFEDVSNSAVDRAYSDGTEYPQMHVYSILAADMDHDADLDLLVTGPRNRSAHRSVEDNTPTARLLRNDSMPGRLAFTDVTDNSGFGLLNGREVPGYVLHRSVPNLAAGVAMDYDNDSQVDFIFADRQDSDPNAPLHPWVFRNGGNGRFELVSPEVHGMTGNFNDLSYGDFHNDGRMDLAFVNGDPRGGGYVAVYRNATANSNHWVTLQVTWPENRFGLESKVTVFKSGTDEVLGYEEVRTDFCYRSKRSPTLHFGLGSATSVDVQVTTRDGRVQMFDGLPTDTTHVLEINPREHATLKRSSASGSCSSITLASIAAESPSCVYAAPM